MKRKYDYIFFEDNKKERILHWFKIETHYKVNEFILYTKDNVYWYCEYGREDKFYKVHQPGNIFLTKRNSLYQLKDGVHKLDCNDKSLWYSVDNFDRFEIVVSNTEG